MNTLSQIGKQISELFASMTPSARIMAALLVGVIVVSFGWILVLDQRSGKSYILGVLSPEEIRRAEQAFGSSMLGDYEIVGGTRIQVPSAERAAYLKALSDSGAVPAQWGDEIKKSLDSGIFDPPSLIARRQDVAKEQEFAMLLRRLPQVEFAAVECDELQRGFAREIEKVCNIQVHQYGNRPIDTNVLKHIAESATTYFAGLKKENVAVFDLGTSNIYRASNDPNAPDDNPVLNAQVDWESKYYKQVGELLSQYGAIKLGVSVELDPTLLEESEKIEFDPTGVATNASSSRSDTETNKPPTGGRPGTNPNALNNPQSIAATVAVPTSKTKESEESTTSQYGQNATKTKLAGLVPKSVKISVGIPESHYRKLFVHRWMLENPDSSEADLPAPTAPELSAIRDEVKLAVESAIDTIPVGMRDGEDRKPFIKVYSYTDLPLPSMPEPTMTATSMAWLAESWSTVAMVFLVLLSLGMMFSWVRSQQGDTEKERQFSEGFGLEVPFNVSDELDLSTGASGGLPGLSGGAAGGGDSDGDSDGDETREKPSFQLTGEDVKEDISSIIKENPEAAVNLLKSWIGDAA